MNVKTKTNKNRKMSKTDNNLKRRQKDVVSAAVPEATTEEHHEDPPNAALTFIQDCIYQRFKSCLDIILAGTKFAVLVYVFLYLFIILQTIVTNIFCFPNGSQENVIFSYVCIITDITDIVLGLTTLYLFMNNQVDKLDIDHLFCVNIVNMIILIINMFKLSAIFVLVNYLHTSTFYILSIHTNVVHWLEIYLLVLFLLRLTVQTLFMVNMVVLVREARKRRTEMKVEKCYVRHGKRNREERVNRV